MRIFVLGQFLCAVFSTTFGQSALTTSFDAPLLSIVSIEQNGRIGVYEQGEEVSIHIQFQLNSIDSHTITYALIDYKGNPAEEGLLNGSFILFKNNVHKVLNFGSELSVGWYKLTFNDEAGNQLGFTTFAVTPDYKQRYNGDTPFAMYTGLQMHRELEILYSEYIKAVKLTGIKWVREGVTWRYLEPSKGKPPDASYIDRVVRLFSEYKDCGINISSSVGADPLWTREGASANTGFTHLANKSGILIERYMFFKNITTLLGGKIDAWEIWNEQDASPFLQDAGDSYAAALKASSAGIKAANEENGTETLTILGGLTRGNSASQFNPVMFQNQVMDYVDVYNTHRHATMTRAAIDRTEYVPIAPIQEIDVHHFNKQYNTRRLPHWITECGIYVETKRGVGGFFLEPTDLDLAAQARYLVTSTVESLALGVQRHFWFALAHFQEGSRQLGLFYRNHIPYPGYAAEAIMTDILGKGEYIGKLTNLPVNGFGELFYTGIKGKEYVAVVWSNSTSEYTIYAYNRIGLRGILDGATACLEPSGGKVTISINVEPQYIVFGGDIDERNYTKAFNYTSVYENDTSYSYDMKPESLHTEQKIILNQKFSDDMIEDKKTTGYKFKTGEFGMVTVEVYNFTDNVITGTVNADVSDDWTIDSVSKSVTVRPGDYEPVEFELKPNEGKADNGRLYELAFVGHFGDMVTSRSLSNIATNENITPKETGFFYKTNEYSKESWGASISKPPDSIVTFIAENYKGGGVTFKAMFHQFDSGNGWFFPTVIASMENYTGFGHDIPEDAAGIMFSVMFPPNFPTGVQYQVFVNYDKSATRFWTRSAFNPIRDGQFHTYFVPWVRLTNWNTMDMTPVENNKINSVEIGLGVPGKGIYEYTLKDVGWYKYDYSGTGSNVVTLNGEVSDNSIITDGSIEFIVYMPEEYAHNPRIVLGNLDLSLEKIAKTDKTVAFSVSAKNIPDGFYELTVNGYSLNGKAITKRVRDLQFSNQERSVRSIN